MSTLASDAYDVVEIRNLDGDDLTLILRAKSDPFFLPNAGDTVRIMMIPDIEVKVVQAFYMNREKVRRAARIPEGLASGLKEFLKVTGHFDQRPNKDFDFFVEGVPLATLTLRERAVLFQEAETIRL